MAQTNIQDLPHEILATIFAYHMDPYQLFNQILTFRNVSKSFRALTDDQSRFWQLVMSDLRNKENLFEGSDEYFATHAFMDQLLFKTHKNKFKELNNLDDLVVVYETKDSELICYESEDESSNIFEKFKEWIDYYSKEKTLVLKAMIQACLGREMIAHMGMNQVRIMINLYFEKLLQPALYWINSWEEKPKEIEWRDEIVFDLNLLEIITTPSLFNEDIAICWSELDDAYSCIPRNYILFIVEKFKDIELFGNNSTSPCMVTHLMKKFSDCGIRVDRMRFSDIGLKRNYQSCEQTDELIPKISKSFYLQHLAVWINSPILLEWCLNVGAKNATLAALSNNLNLENLNVSLEAHVNTYKHDALGLTALHHAIKQGNREISTLLINKYLANPFVESKIEFEGKKLTSFMLCGILNDINTRERAHILDTLTEKYGPVKFEQVNDDKEIHSLEDFDDDPNLEDTAGSTEFGPLKEFVVLETCMESEAMEDYERFGRMIYEREDLDDYSDESESEYGLSYKWANNEIKQPSLKRKRHFNNDYLFNENVKKIKKQVEEFELVQWDPYLVEFFSMNYGYYDSDYISDSNLPIVKVLKRKPNSEEPETEEHVEEDSEKVDEISEKPIAEIQSNTLGPEFITRKDLEIPKIKFKSLTDEITQDYKTDVVYMPNASMLIQQVTEDLISNNFSLATEIANFIGRDYTTEMDMRLAYYLGSSCTNMELYRGRDTTLRRKRDYFVECLNIEPRVRTQLEYFIKDETILKTLIATIEDQFESTYLEEIKEDHTDEDYDGQSSDSSETQYSDDSMLSNLCIEDYFGEPDISYSSISAQSFLDQRKEALYSVSENHFTIHEHKAEDQDIPPQMVVFTTDREQNIAILDSGTDTKALYYYY